MRLFVILSLLHLVLSASEDKRIPCRLSWTEVSNGDALPDSAVESHLAKLYVSRAGFEGETFVGTYDTESQESYFPFEDENGTAVSLSAFQILTNPSGCLLEWVGASDGNMPERFGVLAAEGESDDGVGRALIPEPSAQWWAGSISGLQGGISVGLGEDGAEFLTEYEALIAFSSGMTLDLIDFAFDTDPFGSGTDFLGVDEIHNESPATINQTLTHTKRITETYTLTTNRTWTSTYTDTFTINFIFFSYTSTTTTRYEHSTSETITNTEVTEVAVSRGISVPPYTSIMACSTISMKESADISYSAKAKYSAPGLRNEEVLALLHQDGILEARIVGDAVVVDVKGTLRIAIALNTEFYVKPYDAEDGGCTAIEQGILANRRHQYHRHGITSASL